MPEVIVVGVGYNVSSPSDVMALRTRDYTPTQTEDADSAIAASAPGLAATVKSGGAGPFLDFLREELIPWVDSNYRTLPQVNTLVGDSYGGLFGLYALFHQPDTFTRYLIGSPSIWYGDEVSFEYEEAFARNHGDLLAKIFFSAGSLEEIPGVPESEEFGMVSNTFEMENRLKKRGYPGLKITSHLFDGETISKVTRADN